MLRYVLSSAGLMAAAAGAPAATLAQSSPMPMGTMSMPMGSTAKMPVCKTGDAVVWVNTKSKAFYTSDAAMYGKTKHGKYLCQSAAIAAGDHPAGNAAAGSTGAMGSMKSMSSPAPGPVQTGGTTETNAQPNAVNSSSPSP